MSARVGFCPGDMPMFRGPQADPVKRETPARDPLLSSRIPVGPQQRENWPSVPLPSTCHSLPQARWTLGRDPDSSSLCRKARANSSQCPKRLGLCRASVSLHTPSRDHRLVSASYGLEAGTGARDSTTIQTDILSPVEVTVRWGVRRGGKGQGQ